MPVKETIDAQDAKADLFKPKQPRIPGVAPAKLEPLPHTWGSLQGARDREFKRVRTVTDDN